MVIAYLVVTQMGGLGVGNTKQQEQTQENVVEQAQDAADAINEQMYGNRGKSAKSRTRSQSVSWDRFLHDYRVQ